MFKLLGLFISSWYIIKMAHQNYYLDLCVEAFIVNEGAVLLRLHEKYTIWTGPGGHIDPGEDSNQAVLREIWEEVGMKVELVGPADWIHADTDTNIDLVPPFFVNRHKINDKHDHSAFIFIAKSHSREVDPQTEEDKGVKCIWVNEQELEKLNTEDEGLRPETYRYAKKALEIISR